MLGLSPVAPCDGIVLSGSVADVFDVAQPGYASDSHVFVDVNVTCATSGDAVGLPIGVGVVSGPASSLGASSHCVTRVGTQQTTRSTGAGQGCVTYAVTRSISGDTAGRSTHLLRIPDTAVGQMHQLLVWIDADRDRVHDAGEPYQYVAADFVARSVGGATLADYGLADDFVVEIVPDHSTRIGRAGSDSELRLRLTSPSGTRAPIAGARVGVTVSAGPSGGTRANCVNTAGAVLGCRTDTDGEITVRYRVGTQGVSVLRRSEDTIAVFWDPDQDGQRAFGAPTRFVAHPIAKTINYVALGDSYSAGEAGAPDRRGFEGVYQSDESAADGECNRWNRAYPNVFGNRFLGDELSIEVEFATYACTGAVTLNVFDGADPEGLGTSGDALETNRPSPAASKKFFRRARPGAPSELLTPGTWEPRQAVSLAGEQAASGVDLVTLTIGGNDAEFGRGVLVCALVSRCDPALSAERLSEIEDRVVATLAEVKRVAPDAVVFVLGYPYLTPQVDPCANPVEIRRPGRPPTVELDFSGLPAGCEALWDMYRAAVDECGPLSATGVVRGSLFYLGGAVLQTVLSPDRTRIDYWEAKEMWAVADALNAAVRSAAARSGAHFVDVVGGVPLEDAPSGFRGRFSCNPEESWVNGFVAKEGLRLDVSGADGSSFHPTADGQDAYARILEAYIRDRIQSGDGLSEAGLPLPSPVASSPPRGVGGEQSATAKRQAGGAAAEADGDAARQSETTSVVPSAGLLVPRAAAAVTGCGEPFVSPGGQVTLNAAGFAPNATVTFNAQAASLGTAQLTAPRIAAATADADGTVSAAWTVPAAPTSSADPAPRAYLIDASGLNPNSGTHAALMGLPLVAYPATAPCAVADTATTTLGAAVQMSVLANDIAPTGGSLDAASVEVRPAVGGSFAVNETTGAVTFTPDVGFWGTVETTYVVYDVWGIGVEAELSVTVDAGCTVVGTAGVTLIEGTSGDDVICVPDRDDRRAFHVIDAKGGDDTVLGGAGVEWIYGGDGEDVILGNGGDDRIIAGAGVDTVRGGAGMDVVYSIDMADTVVDDDYEMVLSPSVTVAQSGPEPEDDWEWIDVSQTVEIGVLANDHDSNEDLDPATLTITTPPVDGAAVVAEVSDGRAVLSYTAAALGGTDSFAYEVCDALGSCATAEVTVMVGTADCTIVGTAGDDTIRGTPGDDVICGLGGNDTIRGLGGDDVIVGGPGDDVINAGDGADLVWGGAGADTLDGGPGDDTVWGGAGDDTLVASSGTDRLDGGPGADTVTGGGGDDLIWGGPGADILDGHAGDDTIWGGPGDDMLRGGNGDDTIWGGADNDSLAGGAGADSLHGGPGDDTLFGNTQNDTLRGGPGADRLEGGGHDDELHGGPGGDTLRGGPGDDRLWGGIDADTLDGGNGSDHLDGGSGADGCSRGDTTRGCE